MSERDQIKSLIARIEMDACPGLGDLSTQCCKSLNALKAMLGRDEARESEGGEADLFWDYHNPEDSGHEDEHDLADYCAQDLPYGETMTVDVICAKRLPTRQMKIWVDEDDDLQWEWLTDATPPDQESE